MPEPLFVRCIKGLKEVRLDPGIPRSAASRWRLWAAWAQTEIRILRWRINAPKLTRSEARGDSREDLFYGKQNQKEFIKRYVTPAPKHVVDSVRLENGARCFDPAVYLSEIDKRVGDIFSRRQLFRRHRGKARALWRRPQPGLSWQDPEFLKQHAEALESLLQSDRGQAPAWWSQEYEQGAVEKKEWQDTMRPIQVNELLDEVAAIPAGKAPGHDQLSVDMLKLLFWDEKASAPPPPNISLNPDSGTAEWRPLDGSEANAVVNLVLLLSNTTLALEEVMPSMKLGEICFLPKVKVEGDFGC